MDLLQQLELSGLLDRALAEDIGLGDVTTAATVRPGSRGRARITVKEEQIVFCGGPLIEPILARCGEARVFAIADSIEPRFLCVSCKALLALHFVEISPG